MTQNNPIHANSRFSSLWRKELWGYFSKKSKESIREHITLPKYDFWRDTMKKPKKPRLIREQQGTYERVITNKKKYNRKKEKDTPNDR